MSFLASGIELQNGVLPNGIKIRACKNTVDFVAMQAKLVHQQADRIEKLEAALRFYANDENYRQVWDDQFRTWVTDVLSDNGRTARKALEKENV
jgi:hypothetical protein